MGFNWFGSRINPIGVDFGSDSIKLVQVEPKDNQLRLVAAASADVPEAAWTSPDAYEEFAVEALKKMTHEFGFRGRQIHTCLPARNMHVLHLQMAKLTPEELKKALPFEARGKLPFDPGRAVLRHIIAGEVYHQQETKTEVILMAASRDSVERQLRIIGRAKMETAAMHMEPMALVECFSHLFRRATDGELSTMFVDIGASATHVIITHGRSVVFTKYINVAGLTLNKVAAKHAGVGVREMRQRRWQMASEKFEAARTAPGTLAIGRPAERLRELNSDGGSSAVAVLEEARDSDDDFQGALQEPLDVLLSELELCVRYYDSMFSGKAINRVIFVGGESRHRPICQKLAQQVNAPATLGDPLGRLLKDGKTNCSVDMRQPQPGWAVAVGLAAGIKHAAE